MSGAFTGGLAGGIGNGINNAVSNAVALYGMHKQSERHDQTVALRKEELEFNRRYKASMHGWNTVFGKIAGPSPMEARLLGLDPTPLSVTGNPRYLQPGADALWLE